MEIVTLGSIHEDILHKQAKIITDIDEQIERLANAMIESLETEKGIGVNL